MFFVLVTAPPHVYQVIHSGKLCEAHLCLILCFISLLFLQFILVLSPASVLTANKFEGKKRLKEGRACSVIKIKYDST